VGLFIKHISKKTKPQSFGSLSVLFGPASANPIQSIKHYQPRQKIHFFREHKSSLTATKIAKKMQYAKKNVAVVHKDNKDGLTDIISQGGGM
jgi:hypothetical protein